MSGIANINTNTQVAPSMIELEHPAFFDLITNPGIRKKRHCLKCQCTFISAHRGNRLCGGCNQQNKRYSMRTCTQPEC